MARVTWCRHCDLEPSRRSNGLCNACNTYQAKYDRLPSWSVLHRRLARKEERRLSA